MSEFQGGSRIIPGLRYRDAHAAIEWLVKVFGFVAKAVYDGPDGTVAHAELTLGAGMIMLGSASNGGAWAGQMILPEEIGGRETQAPYLVVADAEAVYRAARAAGTRMVQELEAKEYGGKAFSCRDLEGHLWSVGEYDPWASH